MLQGQENSPGRQAWELLAPLAHLSSGDDTGRPIWVWQPCPVTGSPAADCHTQRFPVEQQVWELYT